MDYYIGMVAIFGFQWAPVDFAYCNGQQMAVNQNQALYALIGNLYGGNSTLFNLPNLNGRKIISQGQSTASGTTYNMGLINGAAGGSEAAQLTQAQLPVHTHAGHFTPTGGGSAAVVRVSTATGTKGTPAAGDYLASPNYGGDGVNAFVPAASAGTTVALGGVSGGGGGGGSVTLDNAGQGQSFSVMNPYLVMNICMCTSGLFPMRP